MNFVHPYTNVICCKDLDESIVPYVDAKYQKLSKVHMYGV